MEHIAEKGCVGSFHCGLVHKPGSIQEAMKIPDAKAAVDKELEKVKTIPTWDVKKKRSNSEVIRQAKLGEFDDLCRLKKAELAKHLQKYKVLWGGQSQGRRRTQSSIHRAMCFSVTDGSGKVVGHYLEASWNDWRNK